MPCHFDGVAGNLGDPETFVRALAFHAPQATAHVLHPGDMLALPRPVTLHHARAGAGPPLVLLAGIGMDGAAWAPVLDRLTPERDVWCVDLPGFGGSAALVDEPPASQRSPPRPSASSPAPGSSGRISPATRSAGRWRSSWRGAAASPRPPRCRRWASGRRAEAVFARLSLLGTYALAARIRRRAPR